MKVGLAAINMEDLIGGHYFIGWLCILGGLWHCLTKPQAFVVRGFLWSGEAYLSYSLSALSVCGFIATVYLGEREIYFWYNNTAYPSEFYGPTGPEASQAQGFTFLVRDQKLGINVTSSVGPTALAANIL